MYSDLHNHTLLCNHATGSIDQYIQEAIKKDIKIFGFSEHAPMHFDFNYRLGFNQVDLYENNIRQAQEKFKDKIDILLAYEVDFLPQYSDNFIFDREVDYLIGSVHFIDEWGFDNPEFIGKYAHQDIDIIWQKYFDLIEAMANSGKYDIAGHLDLIKVFKFLPKKDVRTLAKKALQAIKKANMTLEINGAGLRKPIHEPYPSVLLLEMAFEMDIPISFASDAHAPEHVGLFKTQTIALAQGVGYTKCATYRNKDRELLTF